MFLSFLNYFVFVFDLITNDEKHVFQDGITEHLMQRDGQQKVELQELE